MTEPTDTERRELNERLARATGYRAAPSKEYTGYWVFLDPRGEICTDYEGGAFLFSSENHAWGNCCPDFTRDPAASRELVVWLAAQDAAGAFFFGSFLYHLEKALISAGVHMGGTINRQREFMTASPLLIAIAADASIGGKE